ncbi:hypothetical protein [Flavobacterium cucumis]|nr:hypothetical protein [Flavobacterium cucumis]
MKDLSERGYIVYNPSFNPFKGSTLEVCSLDSYASTTSKKAFQKPRCCSKNEPVVEQANEQLTEQALNKHQTSSKHVPYINIINNTNSINLDKQEISKNEEKLISGNSNFNEVQESDIKIEKENEMHAFDNSDEKQTEKSCQKKLREKKKSNLDSPTPKANNFETGGKKKDENYSTVTSSECQSRPIGIEKLVSKFSKPTLEETQIYFLEKNFAEVEAQRFFNYFESNGWLVGGRAKMKDWKAAARNWMLNAKKYAENATKKSVAAIRTEGSSNPLGSKTFSLNPNHLHVTNHKNYGEAL